MDSEVSSLPERRAMTCRSMDRIGLSDYYRIEWANHEGRRWEEVVERAGSGYTYKVTMCCDSARLEKYTCVEGNLYEMKQLARFILRGTLGEFEGATRCAVSREPDGSVGFWSPRNSNGNVVFLNPDSARDLADEIMLIPEAPKEKK